MPGAAGWRKQLKFFAPSAKWLAIIFASGCVNSGGWLTIGRFLSHVTGFATLIGIELAKHRLLEALAVASVPVYFMAGCMMTAFLTDRRMQRGLNPMYATPLLLAAVMLGAGAFLGTHGHFTKVDLVEKTENEYLLLVLLSLACGLMNAVVTIATGTVMRATHMTGITTDLGIGLVRVHYLSEETGEAYLEKRSNLMRIATLVFFILGSVTGCYLFLEAGYLGFWLPTAITFLVALITMREGNRK